METVSKLIGKWGKAYTEDIMKKDFTILEVSLKRNSGAVSGSNLFLTGFTLIELMLVVIIIGVLSAMVVPRLAGRSEQARIQAAKTDINSSIPLALDLYEMDMGQYPESIDYLRTRPADGESWRGPYLKKRPMDPWNRPYTYKSPGDHNQDGYDLFSAGRDGQAGSADDVVNWGE